MKNLIKIIFAFSLLLPFSASAVTTVPWQQTNLTDGFIFPAFVNGNLQGIILSASSTLQNFTARNSTTTNATSTSLSTSIFTLAGATTGCATFTGTKLSSTGVACGSGSGAAYPFPLSGNATSTLTQFNGGLTAYASSTIGDGTTGGGLTVNGTASTTKLIVSSPGASASATIYGNSSTAGSALSISDNLTSGNIYTALLNPSSASNLNLNTVPLSATFSAGSGTTGGLYFVAKAAAPIIFGTGGTTFANERMRIDPVGNVGIGTAAPNFPLEVLGTASTTNFYTGNATTTNATTTSLSVSGNASTTSLYGSGLFACNGASNALTWNAGKFGCNTITGGGGGGGGGSQWSTSTQPATAIYNNVLGNVGIGTTTPVSRLTVSTTTLVNAATPLGLLIGNRGLVSGSSNGTIFGMNTEAGFTGDLMHFQVGGADEVNMDSIGDINIARNLVAGNAVLGNAGLETQAGGALIFFNRFFMTTPSDGVLTMFNNAGTDFSRLQFGGTSNLFPALGVNTASQSIFVENADGSAGGRFAVGTTSAPSRLTIATTTLVNAATPLGLLIGNNGLVSGSSNGTVIGVNTDAGFSGNLIDTQVNGSDKFKVDNNGQITSASFIVAGNSIQTGGNFFGMSPGLPNGGSVQWNNASRIYSPVDGTTALTNAAATDFSRLEFGSDTSAFPAFTISTSTANGIGALLTLADGTAGGIFGIGTTTAKTAALAVQSNSTSLDIANYATTTGKSVGGTDNAGHQYTAGAAGAVSSCGTGSPSVAGNDTNGVITTGTAATACTYTFDLPFTKAPVCTVTDNSLVGFADISSVSTSAVTFGISSALSGGNLYYHCEYTR